MNAYKLKTTAYANPQTDAEKTVRKALDAYLDGPISPAVVFSLENLEAAYEQKYELPDVELAERYVAECWAEYTNPPGAVYKELV